MALLARGGRWWHSWRVQACGELTEALGLVADRPATRQYCRVPQESVLGEPCRQSRGLPPNHTGSPGYSEPSIRPPFAVLLS